VSILYLGLDVHKDSLTLAVFGPHGSGPRLVERLPYEPPKLRRARAEVGVAAPEGPRVTGLGTGDAPGAPRCQNPARAGISIDGKERRREVPDGSPARRSP